MDKNKNNEHNGLVIGRHAAMAALKGTQAVNKVYVQEKLKSDAVSEIIALARRKSIVVSRVPKAKLDFLSDQQNHQGVAVSVAPFQYATLDDLFSRAKEQGEAPFFLILDEIEDPHNLGSIIRTADAAGVHGVIIPKRRAVQLTATVSKTSTGAVEYVPVMRANNLTAVVKELKKRGVWIFGTDMAGQDFRQFDGSAPTAIVIGNEGKGISPLLKKNCDGMLTIPMTGHVQSLNASVAASLLIYQVYTSRGK
ncbi:rRNA methyltransferase [Ligilactobacillus salitolerans]|uniref:rRNA methyltransferase n=1 Tax=Ligilactobacillus salitolerans TaxID=1808352 RepID=A0A401IUV0_9LACO|nr:23S rRNA (guanosine(2251)-2'-O)-methyltransferase RlmB [Ligilactobacillus salitolerans]GBG95285.1 rRNA methyltransferase [Ligilactobacillus salitolerans]